MRGIQYAEAYRLIVGVYGILDRPPQCAIAHKADDDSGKYSRGAMRPEFCISLSLLEIRGRRESRVHAVPAVSCAMCIKKCCT